MIGRILGAALVAASAAADESTPEIKGADPSLLQDVRSIAERAARVVGTRPSLTMMALRADETTRRAETVIRSERILPPRSAAARGRAWSDLGFGDGTDPASLVRAFVEDLPGMSFDADGVRLLIDPSRLVDDDGTGSAANDDAASLLLATGVAPDEPVVAHYAAHRMEAISAAPAPATTDALVARAALTEGAANLVALAFLFSGAGLASEVIDGRLSPEEVIGGRLVSDAVRSDRPVVARLVEFAYLDGYIAAATLAKRVGFARIGAEIARRGGTRDVMHLDRSIVPPAEFAEPAFASSLGLVVEDRDTLGEQGIVTWVSLLTGKDNLGLIAGDGWSGDALWRLEPGPSASSREGGVTLWASRWGSEEDAEDFAYGVERCLQARFPAEPLIDEREGHKVLRRTDQVFRLDRRGAEVTLRIASPTWDARIDPAQKKKTAPGRATNRKK